MADDLRLIGSGEAYSAVSDCLLGSLILGPESCQATGRAHWEAARARPGDTLFMWHSLATADKNIPRKRYDLTTNGRVKII